MGDVGGQGGEEQIDFEIKRGIIDDLWCCIFFFIVNREILYIFFIWRLSFVILGTREYQRWILMNGFPYVIF